MFGEFDYELYDYSEPEPFSLPSPLPHWPQGRGFATGRMCLGEIEVIQITKFESIWCCNLLHGKSKGVTFYRPAGIPDDFFCLGYYCQPNDQPLRGYVLVARDTVATRLEDVWNADSNKNGCGYIWLPNPPVGYKAMGFVVTDNSEEPRPEEVRCVREDLTEACETRDRVLAMDSKLSEDQFQYYLDSDDELEVACLKNIDSSLHAMPNLNQIHALIEHYGPTIGQHVGDWEHFTLRVSNFTGELWQAYPHPGTYLQGSSKFDIGVRNDASRSKFCIDSSTKYQIVAAEYLGDGVISEPCWLQYMSDWGPTIVYDSRSELDKLIDHLPFFVRFSVENLFDLFPTQLYGEEGPTGPKERTIG
ncbi:Plant protein of unknown function D [Prunus dulcis]|uniref:Uncharacterized protein n=1 Tax=Prunus dulcis TaxID=3755 RepID=A0A4Y1RSM5_PRUDU|nr:Plant protein of unknown function D [Prunus dulcis]